MISINILNQTSAILLTLVLSVIFLVSGIYYSRKYKGLNNYLIANRNIGIFSLTASFVSSALGAWILFGPASAATWGGIGAVIGYALGTAFPLFALITLGSKFRKSFTKAKTLIEVIRLKFGKKLFKINFISNYFLYGYFS
jgi:Na+/proline symporter